MLNNKNAILCAKVIKKNGTSQQMLKAGEECTELAQAIFRMAQDGSNWHHTDNLIEEMVDVIVMTEQLVLITGLTREKINEMARQKLERALGEVVANGR